MTVIFRVNDPSGTPVVLTTDQWEQHIVVGHSVMSGNEEAVRKTIEEPDVIYESSQYAERDVFFKQNTGTTYSNKLYTKVVVDFSGIPGEVVSAWPQKTISGGIGDLKYERK